MRAAAAAAGEGTSPGDGRVHELKFDGYRMLCRIDRGKVTFWSRNEKECTEKFLNVVESLKSLPLRTPILDGESDGGLARPFEFSETPAGEGKSATSGFAYEAFDLIYLEGDDLTRVTLKERKRLLKRLCAASRGTI